jgi:hypothetical protein
MLEPRPAVTDLVRVIARAERATSTGAFDSHVAQRILTGLHRELGKLIGSAGFDVLLARSLVLARRAHPSFAEISAEPGGKLAGLDASAADPAGREEDPLLIVAYFIELLATLIGQDLALRLVRDLSTATTQEEKK